MFQNVCKCDQSFKLRIFSGPLGDKYIDNWFDILTQQVTHINAPNGAFVFHRRHFVSYNVLVNIYSLNLMADA